ncbi:hypothetical protein BGX34_000365 [Mortierella sp. NVP85]|nr:hypothetical protein BGX34_000365 [Mortierella sp. NVP85]
MKVQYLLPFPLLLAPFTYAADYLVRFKEGTPANSQPAGVSRIQTYQGAHPKFDYNAKELSLTLSSSQPKDFAHGHNARRHDKSKVQVETNATTDHETDSKQQEEIQIKSKGRWFTFGDTNFHVWHGDFSEQEAELLANDAGVELVEKDMVIRFAELEEYNNKTAMEAKVLRLEHAFDLLDEQMAARQELLARGLKSEEDSEVSIPNSGRKDQKESSTRKSKIDKSHEPKDYTPTVITEDVPGPNNAYTIQQRAPSWGLPRVSQRNLPLSTDYNYPNAAGEGVDVYIIDTGISIHHTDFEGRARWGTTTVPGAPNTDDNGHGTFVAGVIGSRTFGVAKKVNLIAVKSLNREGTSTLSQILAALDWVIKQSSQSTNHRTVVNLSLGAGYSKVLNSAVDTLVQSGLFIVTAAGNGNEHNIGQNACEYSPASTPTAFTVGSTNINDQMSSFSNYGQCVNIYAPGERVRSTWIGPTNREIYTDSGTSFSAPNVAGIAALIMSSERGDRSDGSWSPKNIGNRILRMGTRGVVRNFKGPDNTNIMAFNGVGILGVTNVSHEGSSGTTSDGNGELGKDNGSQSDGHSSIPSMSGGNYIGPHLVSGPSSSSSSTNHGLTLSVIHVLAVLATLTSTLTAVLSSL